MKTRRTSRFLVVGLFNTGLDFSILNALVFGFGLSRLPANIISSSVAMVMSYMLNHRFVFRHDEEKNLKQFLVFIVITAFGLLVLQNLTIYIFTHQLRSVPDAMHTVLDWVVSGVFTKEFIELNFGKAVATIVTMVWNYKLYQRFVFVAKNKLDHVE